MESNVHKIFEQEISDLLKEKPSMPEKYTLELLIPETFDVVFDKMLDELEQSSFFYNKLEYSSDQFYLLLYSMSINGLQEINQTRVFINTILNLVYFDFNEILNAYGPNVDSDKITKLVLDYKINWLSNGLTFLNSMSTKIQQKLLKNLKSINYDLFMVIGDDKYQIMKSQGYLINYNVTGINPLMTLLLPKNKYHNISEAEIESELIQELTYRNN